MARGQRRSPYHILADEEIAILKKDLEATCADISVFIFNKEPQTSYSDTLDVVLVRGVMLYPM